MSLSLRRLTGRLLPMVLPCLLLFAFLLLTTPLEAEGVTRRLVPIGASYQVETLEQFAAEAIEKDTDGTVELRVLPITYATDAFEITPEERQENLDLALGRADELRAACESVATGGETCVATVPDIQVRDDASDPDKVAELGPGVDGIYILGGDQTIAMLVVANTPAEEAMEARYNEGAPVGGNSAGAAVISRYMIGGYTSEAWPWDGLEVGALDLWYGATETVTRGLRFGVDDAVVDQHVLERGRLARLLQATEQKPGLKLGLGVDWGTGAVIENEALVNGTAGYYAAVVVDEETYGSAAGAAYLGPSQTLSIKNVALHLLPEGPYGYDLAAQRPVVDGVTDPDVPQRPVFPYDMLIGRRCYSDGSLMLGGDQSEEPTGLVMTRFAERAASLGGPTVVLAAAYVTEGEAESEATFWADTLETLGVADVQTATLSDTTDLDALRAQLEAASAIFITGNDQPTMAARVPLLRDAPVDICGLLDGQGKVVMLDNAAAAAAGEWMSDEPTPTEDDLEYQSSDSFLVGYVSIAPGLGLIQDAVVEPRVLYDYLYGRLVSHVYAHPDVAAFGIERGSAIDVSVGPVVFGAAHVGSTAVLAVDGREAHLMAEGANGTIAATWLFMDSYAGGEDIYPQPPTAVHLADLTTRNQAPMGAAALLAAGLALAGAVAWRRR